MSTDRFTPPDHLLPDPTSAQRQILTVAQLNGLAKRLLEDHLPLMWVEGEISNFVKPSSGHWYFTLKDARAQVRCAMFKGRNREVKLNPRQGDRVVVRARVSLYEGRGDYQLIIEHMEPAGLGDLQRQFELLKAKLTEEGLFAPERKAPLPSHPLHIGVITSPTGAAIRDILSVLKRRMPSVPVTVVPTLVQGETAAAQLRQALHIAQQSGLFDVLIVTRGGGSLEDLWCFNDEGLARDIAACPIPIVSAVGHEIDFTIADFVADYRAPTPSAAAEILSQSQQELLKQLAHYHQRLQRAWSSSLHHKTASLAQLKAKLRHPGDRLQHQMQRLDQLEIRLRSAVTNRLARFAARYQQAQQRINQASPAKTINELKQRLTNTQHRLTYAAKQNLGHNQARFGALVQRLDAISPLNTLKRGYAIAQNSEGIAITSAETVNVGDEIKVTLAEGKLDCQVLTKT